jgi:hypothetical protein
VRSAAARLIRIKGSRLVIEGRHFTLKEGDVTYRGTFKVDVTKKPQARLRA